jgi:hypothetical protein
MLTGQIRRSAALFSRQIQPMYPFHQADDLSS